MPPTTITASRTSLHGAVLLGPRNESVRRVLDAINVCVLYATEVAPSDIRRFVLLRSVLLRLAPDRSVPVRSASVRSASSHVGAPETGALQVALAKIRRTQVGVGEIGEIKISIAHVRGTEVRSQTGAPVPGGSLQESARNIDADQWNAIVVEFLERVDATAAAAFSLRGVDDLPRLIVLLLEAVARFRKVEDDRDQAR